MKDSEKETVWAGINSLIFCLLLFGGMIFLGYTYGITSALFDIGLPVNIALGLLYKLHIKYGHFRKIVIVLRIIAIIICMLSILAPIILMSFRHTEFMYPIKRFCYGYGVYSERFNNDILPENLPEKCDDYLFITRGSMVAQDYHADAYLIFHTDKKTLQEYDNHFKYVDDAERYIAHMPDKEEYDDYLWLECPEEFPKYVFQRLEPEHIHNFEKAVIYTIPSYYSKGCMLDYDSGLAVFWY